MPAIPLHHISFTTGSIAHINTKGRWSIPPVKTTRDGPQSELITVQCCPWEPQADEPPHYYHMK